MDEKEIKKRVEEKIDDYVGQYQQKTKEALNDIMEKYGLGCGLIAPFFGVSGQSIHLWLGPRFVCPPLKYCKGIVEFVDAIEELADDYEKDVESWKPEKGIGHKIHRLTFFDQDAMNILKRTASKEEKVRWLVKRAVKKWAESVKQEKE